jgi:long-chain-fatty-acid--CoA ligase ACSBG
MSSLPLSTSEASQEVAIRMGNEGIASLPPKTVMQNFDAQVTKNGNRTALYHKRPKQGQDVADVAWTKYSWKEYRQQVDSFGKALLKVGFARFDTINIIGFNAPEWFFANFGAIAAGGIPAGVYTTNNPEACAYVAEHSKAKVVVCEGVKQLEKYYEISRNLPNLTALVMYGTDTIPEDVKSKCSVPVYTFEGFLDLGKDVSDTDLKARTDSWKAGETCTLIYTSGTTGPPKAVMITNDNITWTIETLMGRTRKGTLDHNDVMISYLPLSHIAAQMLDMHNPMATGTQLYFADANALKGSLGQTLKEVRPTVFFGVPRVWEKIYDKLQEVARSSTGIKKMLSTWAKGKAAAHWESLEYGSKSGSPFMLFLAKKLLHKAHLALGFDRCIQFYVSAAPIEVKILKYFMSLDIPIMELFGQSECTGPHAVNGYDAFKVGTVGRPLIGTETKIDEATGELCYRGRHIFAGYMGMPDKTTETIDSQGWLHSGDIVAIDSDHHPEIKKPSGFISITGRIKELIITAGGENVAPVLIEDELKAAMPALANAMVIGDKRKFLSVLLCLQVEPDIEGNPTNKLTGNALEAAKTIGSKAKTTNEARDDPKWKEYFDKGLEVANKKAISRASRVGKWTLLSTDFSEVGGELTPTMKLKRNVTAEKFADTIDAMYA